MGEIATVVKIIIWGVFVFVCGFALVQYLSYVPGGGPSIHFYPGRYYFGMIMMVVGVISVIIGIILTMKRLARP